MYSKVTFFNRIEQLINKQITTPWTRSANLIAKTLQKSRITLALNYPKYNQQEDGITPDEVAFLSNSWATDNIMNVIIQELLVLVKLHWAQASGYQFV